MRVQFKTSTGSEYLLDHDTKTFYQLEPQRRDGPMYSSPAVVIGKPVEIWTSQEDGRGAFKLIITGTVIKRTVVLV